MPTQQLTYVPLAAARPQIADGDLLLFRRRNLIAVAGRGEHSHAAKAAWWDDELFCLEVREWHGGRKNTRSCMNRTWSGAGSPRIGDSIVDVANDSWTILSVEIRGAKTRLRCVTRNLQIVHELLDRVEIQTAVWEDSGSGPEIVGWTTLLSAVPARIQPDQTTVDNSADPPTSIATYRVMLANDTPLDHNHRLIGPDGTLYQLVDYMQGERIDTLPVATVSKLANP